MTDKESRMFFNRVFIEVKNKINKLMEILGCTIEYRIYDIVIHYEEKILTTSPIEIHEKSIGEIIDMVLGYL